MERTFCSELVHYASGLGSATKTLCCAHLLLYFASLLLYPLVSLFYNIPFYLWTHYEVWRLLTGSLAGEGFIALVLGLVLFSHLGSKLERALGSAKFVCWFFFTGTLSNTLLDATLGLSSQLLGAASLSLRVSYGLWGVITVLAVQRYWKVLDAPVPIVFTNFNIKSKYIPVFLLVLMLLLGLQWEGLLGVFLGQLCNSYTDNTKLAQKLVCSEEFWVKLEDSVLCACLTVVAVHTRTCQSVADLSDLPFVFVLDGPERSERGVLSGPQEHRRVSDKQLQPYVHTDKDDDEESIL